MVINKKDLFRKKQLSNLTLPDEFEDSGIKIIKDSRVDDYILLNNLGQMGRIVNVEFEMLYECQHCGFLGGFNDLIKNGKDCCIDAYLPDDMKKLIKEKRDEE